MTLLSQALQLRQPLQAASGSFPDAVFGPLQDSVMTSHLTTESRTSQYPEASRTGMNQRE